MIEDFLLFKTFNYGDTVRKKSGSEWQGKIVGFYSTNLTREGYAVESDTHKGSVQIYPVSALELLMNNLDRYYHNNNCNKRDECQLAQNDWTENEIFSGEEKDCHDFVELDDINEFYIL